ncbi:MAG: DNA repair protein RecN, partial [Micrococcales bacterium]
FDEVDAGVGGATAIEVGKRLAQLALRAQVIVVTHLAQVAAFADHHLTVRKSADSSVTESDVSVLVGDERTAELARMLSGLSDSESGNLHAAELLSLAKSGRER